MSAMSVLKEICELEPQFIPAAIIPPATDSADDKIWHRPIEMLGNDPNLVALLKSNGHTAPPAMDHYDDRTNLIIQMFSSSGALLDGWLKGDVARANDGAKALAAVL